MRRFGEQPIVVAIPVISNGIGYQLIAYRERKRGGLFELLH